MVCYTVSMADEIDQDYRHSNGAVYLLRLHFIWIPRRRRKVLVGLVAERLDTLIREKAAELDLDVLRLAIQPDHMHLLVGVDPKIAPAQIAYRLKGYTAHILRQEFPHLRKMPSMWTTSYFVSSAGNISAVTIEQYIQSQSTRA
jgi:putative transposase